MWMAGTWCHYRSQGKAQRPHFNPHGLAHVTPESSPRDALDVCDPVPNPCHPILTSYDVRRTTYE
jgi:hypothetical protein